MPPIPARRMTKAQREAAREIASGPRGAVVGPFIAALRSPEFMRRLQKLGEYLRYHNALPPRLCEMAILLVARDWTQQFEWSAHAKLAAERGLKRDIVAAVAAGRRPDAMADDEALIHEFYMELERAKSISDATYARAVRKLGEQGVIDLIGIIGYYATLARIMNVARTPLPAGQAALLAPFPDT
jgi:4-carboxymuconolactone decarboxylase